MIDMPWIVAPTDEPPRAPDDDGWVTISGEWDIRSGVPPAEFIVCGAWDDDAWGIGLAAVCLAESFHEHPHVACRPYAASWACGGRVIGVRRHQIGTPSLGALGRRCDWTQPRHQRAMANLLKKLQ